MRNKTHITETRTVNYRWHPWHGRTVFIFAQVDKNNTTVIRCALEPAQSARPLEVPKWMFDEAFCARCALRDAPRVPWRTLRELVELLSAADGSGDVNVVQDTHLDRLDRGGADATHQSPTAGRPAKNLFHPAPVVPQWMLLPPEARQKALSLLARLLRHHRRRFLGGGPEEEVRDE